MAQCPKLHGVIWTSSTSSVTIGELSLHAAPKFWFSPDEPGLRNDQGEIVLPEPFSADKPSGQPLVYYKLRNIYAHKEEGQVIGSSLLKPESQRINLQEVKAMDLEYYLYYKEETGLGGHPHDLESVALQLEVVESLQCEEYRYAIAVKKVIARAHGLTWFENSFIVDDQTNFPLTILIEEGKHANCTDKNGDGIYTPGYDVTKKVNDAWGVRDIISSGNLFSGGFQAWMAKLRNSETLIIPELPNTSPFYEDFREEHIEILQTQVYILRAFPDILSEISDSKLRKMIKSKKPAQWPTVIKVSGDGSILQWSKENKPYKSIGISWRHDEVAALSFSVPLLIFKNVSAPLTGGWLNHKIYLGTNVPTANGMTRSFGHQIVHSTSASRWFDTYVGLGYEILDQDIHPEIIQNEMFFVSEIGLKIRANITNTPLRFLKFLGTEYWGVRLGWKNLGYNPFLSSGFVIEFGAGVF